MIATCGNCGNPFIDNERSGQRFCGDCIEDVADEIAHDLVSPPDDDASGAALEHALERLAVVQTAVCAALARGATLREASEAGRAAL